MKTFMAGVVIALLVVGGVLLIWWSLDDQARGVVVGVVLGIVGLAAGMVLAFAVVGVFLLIQLRWTVTSTTAPPVMHGAPPPLGLQAPEYAPRNWRGERQWDVVGSDAQQEHSTPPPR